MITATNYAKLQLLMPKITLRSSKERKIELIFKRVPYNDGKSFILIPNCLEIYEGSSCSTYYFPISNKQNEKRKEFFFTEIPIAVIEKKENSENLILNKSGEVIFLITQKVNDNQNVEFEELVKWISQQLQHK